MRRNKKRSSILKRPSTSSIENNSPQIDAIGVTTTTKSSKRISFSGKSKVKEFASGDDCITIWNNSYEKSAEHCSTAALVTNNTTVGSDMTMKPPHQILSGPNKENITISDLSYMASGNVSMSATLQFETTLALNNLIYKSPGRVLHKAETEDKILSNDSMELEDLQTPTIASAAPTLYRKTIFSGEMSLDSGPEIKSDHENESNDSEMSLELFCGDMKSNIPKSADVNHKTVLFDKENIEISQIIPSQTAENSKKRNRRQTKIELCDMDLSSVNVTPTVPAKRDKKIDITDQRKLSLDSNDMDETLMEKSVDTKGAAKTVIFHNDQMIDDTASTKGTQHINDENMIHPEELQKMSEIKGARSILKDRKPFQSAKKSIYVTEEMHETLVGQSGSTMRKTQHFENDQMAFENVSYMPDVENMGTQACRETIYIVENMNETMADQRESSNMMLRNTDRRTKHFVNESMAIEVETHSKRRQTTLAPVNMNMSEIETTPNMGAIPKKLVQQTFKVKRGTIYAAQEMNETLADKPSRISLIQDYPRRKTNYFENEDMAIEPDNNIKPTKNYRTTMYNAEDMNETLTNDNGHQNVAKPQSTSRKTKYFVNESMAIEMNQMQPYQNRRLTTLAPVSMNESEIESTEKLCSIPIATMFKDQKSFKVKRGTIYATQEMNETLGDKAPVIYNVEGPVTRRTQLFDNEEMAIESNDKPFSNCRATIYDAEDMNETMANQQGNFSTKAQSTNRKTKHFVNESMALETSKIQTRRQTTLAAVSMNESEIESTQNMATSKPSFVQKSFKINRGTIYATQEIDETLVVDSKVCSQRKTKFFENEDMAVEPNTNISKKPSKTVRGTIYNTESMNETLVDETDKMQSYPNRRQTVLTAVQMDESNSENINKDPKNPVNISKVPARSTRGTVYAHKEIDETLLEQKEETESDSSKNALKRNRRLTTVDNLSMNLSSLNVTPKSNIPRKKERKESPFTQEGRLRYSDMDLSLENLSIAPNAHSTHHAARISADMNITKASAQKSNHSPSKIPVSAKMNLEPKLTRTDGSKILTVLKDVADNRKTIYDQSIEIEQFEKEELAIELPVNEENSKSFNIDSDEMDETLVAEKQVESANTTKAVKYNQPDFMRRQTSRYSTVQMAELSTKRFKDLTMQSDEMLERESDINLTINSSITEPLKSNNDTLYLPCSYANITLENVVSPRVSNIDLIKQESCVCPVATLQENSFSISTIAGISPNVSVRLSLGNEVVEQIRQRVMKQTPLYCKNCKCMSESCVNQLQVNGDVAPLIDWARFAQAPRKIALVDDMEKEFLQACQTVNKNTDIQKPEIPPIKFLLENMKECLNERLKEYESELIMKNERCPAPYPATKPYIHLIKNKLESEAMSWTVARSIHAPIGKFQLRNDKVKSVLLHFCIEQTSLKSKETFIYQSVRFIKNLLHPPSSPFTAVLFDAFIKIFPLEAPLHHMCPNSSNLFDFLEKIDETISQMHANIAQLFSILKDNKANVYIENSILVAKTSVIDDGTWQIIRVFMNLSDPANFQPHDIRTEPEIPNLWERCIGFNLKGLEFLEYFLSNIKQFVLNK